MHDFKRMPWILATAASIPAWTMSGCVAKQCTEQANPSIVVKVRASDAPVCDATVTAEQGSSREGLLTQGSLDCQYAGPWEKTGTFTVTASKPGYRPATAVVTVDSDECHVVTQHVELTLEPLGDGDAGVPDAGGD